MRKESLLLSLVVMAILVPCDECALWAQEESREDRYFRYLDSNNDGRIDGDELRRADDRMKGRLREAGIDPEKEQEVSRDRFIKSMQARKDDRDRGREGDGRGRESSNRPQPKAKVVLRLSGTYAAFDKNGDNQIGLYEWDRARRAEFLTLDRNQDGFLTARELDDPPKSAATAVATGAVAATTPPAAAATASAVVKQSAVAAPPAKATVSDAPAESSETRRAKYFFSLTDKDKNGEISVEEWNASRGVRVMFEKASITAPPPFKEDAFVQHFLSIKKP